MYALPITLGSFALILVLARFKVPLPAAIVAGGAVCGLALGVPPVDMLVCMLRAVVQPRTIGLIAVVGLLLVLSSIMRAGGRMERIVDLAKRLMRRPVIAMAALPALIGMLPMPGGALFSAPMVESAAGGEEVPPGILSSVNYWYRHVWEYWWPLFPGLILASTITEQPVGMFFVYNFPLSLLMIVAGLGMFRGMHPNLHAVGPRPPRGVKREFVKATSSIWLVLVVWLVAREAMRLIFPGAGADEASPADYGQKAVEEATNYVPVMAGIAVSLIVTTLSMRLSAREVRNSLRGSGIPAMLVLVAAVMVFQGVLDDARAPARIGTELTDMHVPVAAVFAILPYVAGLVTGLAIGFVGTSFPILMGLLAATPAVPHGPYIALAYLFGHMGQMTSPLHLCQVVSNRYFKTTYGPVYRKLIPAAVTMVMLGVGYVVLLTVLSTPSGPREHAPHVTPTSMPAEPAHVVAAPGIVP
jgi:hypothetical protein